MKFLEHNNSYLGIELLDAIFDELANKYSINSLDVKNIFISSLEKIFKNNILCTKENNQYCFYLLHEKNKKLKKVSFSERIKKDLERIFRVDLEEYYNRLKIDRVKKILKSKELVKYEILKKDNDSFVCRTKFGIAKLPFSNIAKVDFPNFNIGGMYQATIHSYKRTGEVILNAKSNEVEMSKLQGLFRGINIYKINRYYGVRVKIYTDIIPKQIVRESIKLVYPNEKIQYILIKKERAND